MKFTSALTVAAMAVPLTAAVLLPRADTTTAVAPRDGKTFEGAIGGWMVEEDGSVVVRLRLDSGEDRWLRTAPNQSSTTQFELLALHTVLALGDKSRQQGVDVLVRAESTTEDDGSSAEHAMTLTAIGRK